MKSSIFDDLQFVPGTPKIEIVLASINPSGDYKKVSMVRNILFLIIFILVIFIAYMVFYGIANSSFYIKLIKNITLQQASIIGFLIVGFYALISRVYELTQKDIENDWGGILFFSFVLIIACKQSVPYFVGFPVGENLIILTIAGIVSIIAFVIVGITLGTIFNATIKAISSLIGLIGIFCVFWYRVSIKMVAFVWFPLMLALNSITNPSENIINQIKFANTSKLWELIKTVSFVLIIVILFKAFVLPIYKDEWNEMEWTRILNIYLLPEKPLNIWNIATFLNCILALFLYYYFFELCQEKLEGFKWSVQTVRKYLTGFSLVRGVLSTYTIYISLILTLQSDFNISFSGIDWSFLPKW